MGEDKGHPFRGNQYGTGASGGRISRVGEIIRDKTLTEKERVAAYRAEVEANRAAYERDLAAGIKSGQRDTSDLDKMTVGSRTGKVSAHPGHAASAAVKAGHAATQPNSHEREYMAKTGKTLAQLTPSERSFLRGGRGANPSVASLRRAGFTGHDDKPALRGVPTNKRGGR